MAVFCGGEGVGLRQTHGPSSESQSHGTDDVFGHYRSEDSSQAGSEVIQLCCDWKQSGFLGQFRGVKVI